MTALGVWAPAARNVGAVVDGEQVELHRGPDGWWRADREVTHGSDYGFLIDDGELVLPDPTVRQAHGAGEPTGRRPGRVPRPPSARQTVMT